MIFKFSHGTIMLLSESFLFFFFVELSQYFMKVLLFSVTIFTFLNETIAISLEGLTALA